MTDGLSREKRPYCLKRLKLPVLKAAHEEDSRPPFKDATTYS